MLHRTAALAWLVVALSFYPHPCTTVLGPLSVRAFPNRVYQQMVGVRIAATGAEYLCFTLDDRPPACSGIQALTCQSGIFSLGDSKILTITSDHTIITAIGCSETDSTDVQSAHVRLPPATPVLSPAAGARPAEVAISAVGAERMCHTLDDTDPVCGPGDPPCLRGTVLLGDRAMVPLAAGDDTLRVIGCSAGGAGWVATARYALQEVQPEAPPPPIAHNPPLGITSDPDDAHCGVESDEGDGEGETTPEAEPVAARLGPPMLHLSQAEGRPKLTVSAGPVRHTCHTVDGSPPRCGPPGDCAEGVQRSPFFHLSSAEVQRALKVVGCTENSSSPAVTLHLVLPDPAFSRLGMAFLVALAIVSTVAAHCMLYATRLSQGPTSASAEAMELQKRLLQVQQMMESAARKRERQAVQWEQQLSALNAQAEALRRAMAAGTRLPGGTAVKPPSVGWKAAWEGTDLLQSLRRGMVSTGQQPAGATSFSLFSQGPG